MLDYGFFTEDQFRVNSRVTLHYGLRYEYTSLPQPAQANPDYPDSGQYPFGENQLCAAVRHGGGLQPRAQRGQGRLWHLLRPLRIPV